MAGDVPLRTPLYSWHEANGGRLVEFGGWSMPVQYTTIVEEHNAVRQRVGLFDISHMGRLTFGGPDALTWLERVTTNHVRRLEVGQIQYSLMVNDEGGVIDDVLVYCTRDGYALVCNASNRAQVVEQLQRHHAGVDASLSDRTVETAMIAVQGPSALATVHGLVEAPVTDLNYYHSLDTTMLGEPVRVCRTGYTGEDGFELIVHRAMAEPIWNALLDAGRAHGIVPCGLGARDTLRFEAAMPLYGHELSATINPYAAGVGWAVKLAKGDFVGRDALRAFKRKPGQVRVGLRLEGKRIARQGCSVLFDGSPVGTVTSGTFAPTLGQSLAMALVDPSASGPGATPAVDVRGHFEPARVVPLPFYQRAGAVKAGP